MPKIPQPGESSEPTLSEVVTISRQFLRSVRVDTDAGNEDALLGYICQGTASALLENMARQISETPQRAFTWTGPYGGGKSSLALMLRTLVGDNAKHRAKVKQILGFAEDSVVYQTFAAKERGWLVVPVVGKRTDVAQELSQAFDKARGNAPSRKRKTDIVAELVGCAENHPQGVLVVIDELGKLLEASASEGGDIHIFQELAEQASRCKGKLVIVGILHQSFEAYASRLGRKTRDEWAKVQGRYVDIPLVAAADEVIELIGKAISTKNPPDLQEAGKISERIANVIRTRRPGTPTSIGASLLACWPLHPVTAALLGPISRRRFGQNERSTFGFLASREPLGFVEFLQGYKAHWYTMYGPAAYWDYLRTNLEPAIAASPDGHRWAQCSDAVERAESKGNQTHVSLTKAVALIEMFRNGSGLVADEQVLAVSTPGVSESEIKKALIELSDWKILIERKHLGAWGIYAGSDFDIEGAITAARGEIGEADFEKLSSLIDLQPVLAKRHYQKTGTMRWFTRGIAKLEELEKQVASFQHKGAAAGAFLMCLPEIGQTTRSAEHRIRQTSLSVIDGTLLLGTPRNAERIAELSLELNACERVMKTRPELHGDTVARREIVSRIESVRSSLEEELADAFSLSKWYVRGSHVEVKGEAILSVIASDVAEGTYYQAPHIFSELLNRESPSSNSVKARKDLMYRMVNHGHQPKLGYEGFPADAGLYFTLLSEPGLHSARAKGEWSFGTPNKSNRGKTFEDWWEATKAALLKKGAALTLADLYEIWAKPPYGIRSGVMPILALAFFLANRSSLALYVNNVFTPDVTESAVDEWTLDPTRVLLQYVEASEEKSSLVKALAQTLSERTSVKVGAEPLAVARGLVNLAVSLPGWTKRTSKVSERTQKVRAMLLKASDPLRVIFTDLPTLLEAQDTKSINGRLQEVADELVGAYGKMLDSVKASLFNALDHQDGTVDSLRLRALTVKGITGDFKLDAFATRLETFADNQQSIESIISLAVDKPPASWVDRDIDLAIGQLASWSIEFRTAETMAPLRGRPSSRRVIGVVFGASHGLDASGSIEVAEKDTSTIDRLVKQILVEHQGERSEVFLAALAEAGAHLINRIKRERQ